MWRTGWSGPPAATQLIDQVSIDHQSRSGGLSSTDDRWWFSAVILGSEQEASESEHILKMQF